MTRNERAVRFAKQLKAATDPQAEAKKIKVELDGLVWAETRQPITKEEKRAILVETKKQVVVLAGDNSAIIDIIDALEIQIKMEE